MSEPSGEWTPEERLQVIAKIAREMHGHPLVMTNERLFDWYERLWLLSAANAGTLETNRDSILNGKRVSE